MNTYLYFIFGAIAGGAVIWLIVRQAKRDSCVCVKEKEKEAATAEADSFGPAPSFAQGFGGEGQDKMSLAERQAQAKEEHKKKILALFVTAPIGRITNSDVERALGVSDATATRYLDELEKERLVCQVGEVGRSVYYEKI